MIDDQPEVTIDDPSFLFESNEGFQEVTSKKTLKIKQKQIEAEQKKTEKEAQKKKEHNNKVRLIFIIFFCRWLIARTFPDMSTIQHFI